MCTVYVCVSAKKKQHFQSKANCKMKLVKTVCVCVCSCHLLYKSFVHWRANSLRENVAVLSKKNIYNLFLKHFGESNS